MKNRDIKKILIFGHSNIGDICYDMVVVNHLKIAFPQAKISFVTSPKGLDIGTKIKGIDELIIFDKHFRNKGLWGYLRFVSAIRVRKFDLAIILRDMQMYYFFNIPKVLKYKKSALPGNTHPAEKYLNFLQNNKLKAEKTKFDFKFSDDDLEYSKKIFKLNSAEANTLRIGIMPLAAWPLKCWPIDSWNKLIGQLSEQFKAKVFLFGRTGDSAWDKQAANSISAKAVSLIDRTTLAQSMALIKSLDIFIGPDSSLLHLASCMGIETIGLYGATDPDFIYPLFHKHNIIRSQSKLECMPCYPGPKGGSCNVHEPAECMNAITVEQVWEKISSIVNRKNNKQQPDNKG